MTELDGFQLHGFFSSGARRLGKVRARIDAINMFPVPDGDTGSNMAATLTQAMEAAIPVDSASETLAAIADAAIESARGNSGVILAQFLSGLSETVLGHRLNPNEFANAVTNAHERAKSAVSVPRDGSILSLIGGWAESLSSRARNLHRFDELIHQSTPDLERSLELTRNVLPENKAAGVVDAGAAGFVEMVHGAGEYLRQLAAGIGHGWGGESERTGRETVYEPVLSHENTTGDSASEPTYRYCTEAVLAAPALDEGALRARLTPLGDSLIVACGSRRARIHQHTDDPARFVAVLEAFGQVSGHKTDDMRAQYRDAHTPHAATVIVTDSCCDLPDPLMTELGVRMVPLLLNAGGSEYLDKLTLTQERFWSLSEKRGAFPRTSQPSTSSFTRLYDSLAPHYDTILSIHLAAALSGTCQTAMRAARESGNSKVRVVDSRHLSVSLGLIVYRAARALQNGMSAAGVLAALPEWARKTRHFVSVTHLRYMVRGGRVSPLKGLAAKLLNLKPIVSVDEEGKSVLYGKTFSERANLGKIRDMAMEAHRKEPVILYAIGHARASEKAHRLAADMEQRVGFPPLYITPISPVVALNSGPGAVSLIIMS